MKALVPQGLTGSPNYFGLLNNFMTLIICESLREIGEMTCVTPAWSSRGQTLKSMVNSPQHSIYRESGDGPIFGGGHAILISNYANSNTNSYTDFRNNYYNIPSGVQNRKTILAGSYTYITLYS